MINQLNTQRITHYRRTDDGPWIFIGHLSARTIQNFLQSGTYSTLRTE